MEVHAHSSMGIPSSFFIFSFLMSSPLLCLIIANYFSLKGSLPKMFVCELLLESSVWTPPLLPSSLPVARTLCVRARARVGGCARARVRLYACLSGLFLVFCMPAWQLACACLCACVPACLRACVPACLRACAFACLRACVHACLCTSACLHACVCFGCFWLRACVRAYACVFVFVPFSSQPPKRCQCFSG